MVVLLGALSLWACLGAAGVEPTSGYATIQRAFLREEFSTVASLAAPFIAQNPDVPETPRVWLWLILSLDRLQRSPEALTELDALKHRLSPDDPLWPEALFWEGEISRRGFQMIRARSAYEQLLERSPDSMWASQAKLGLGLIELQQQEFAAAIERFRALAVEHAGSPIALDAQLYEGLCQLRLKAFPEAAQIFQPLVDRLKDPAAIAQASFYLGESLSALNRYEEAVQAYQRAVAAPGHSAWGNLARFGLGWALYQSGRCEESVEAFERFLSGPGDDYRTEALFAQASCLLRMGLDREALSRFEQVVSRTPDHPLALESGLALADAYRRQERTSLAKELLHGLLRRHPDSASRTRVQLRLGAIALEQGNAAQAKTVYELAIESDDPLVRQSAVNGLGDVSLFLGDAGAAKEQYQRAGQMALGTTQADYAAYQLGRIQLLEGDPAGAVATFQRLTASPDAALADDARLALALAYLRSHEEGLARALLETIRRQRPESVAAMRATYYVALLTLEDGDPTTARQLCEVVMGKIPRTDEALEARLLVAEILADQVSVRDAMAWLRAAYETAKLPLRHRGKLAARLGQLARGERRFAEAIRWYAEAAAILPSLSGEATYHIASCYEEGGDAPLAAEWYQRVDQNPWRVRGQLAAAKLFERDDRMKDAEAIYESLAEESVPEAKVAEEHLAALRQQAEGEARE